MQTNEKQTAYVKWHASSHIKQWVASSFLMTMNDHSSPALILTIVLNHEYAPFRHNRDRVGVGRGEIKRSSLWSNLRETHADLCKVWHSALAAFCSRPTMLDPAPPWLVQQRAEAAG